MNKLTKQLCTDVKCDKASFELLDLVKNPGRKSLLIGLFVSVLGPLSGCGTIGTYAGAIFEAAGSIISPNTSMIVVSIVQFIATLITCRFIERAGRRVILFFFLFSINSTMLNDRKLKNHFLIILVLVHCVNKWNGNGIDPVGCIHDAEIMAIRC